MDRDKLKLELERLVAEASRIAPSIARFNEGRNYGKVTDENLDNSSSVRWELEAGAALEYLATSRMPTFRNLYNEYRARKEAAKKFHSRSILIHKIVELLVGAIQLLDSPLSLPEQVLERRSNLSPWPVIRGLLLQLSSYDVPGIVDRSGLSVDWNLTLRENYSNSTRLAAYRGRIDAAYENLSGHDDCLRVAYTIAQELASRGFADQLNEALRDIGWQLRDSGLVPAGETSRELFFPEQSQHDAYVEIRAILQRAKSRIRIVDPYIDQLILTLLSRCLKPSMRIDLLTSKVPDDFVLEAKRWLAQYTDVILQARATREFHDRFIVLDDTLCWHIGCSIKDAGNKAFMLNEVEDDENRRALLEQFDKSWSAARSIL